MKPTLVSRTSYLVHRPFVVILMFMLLPLVVFGAGCRKKGTTNNEQRTTNTVAQTTGTVMIDNEATEDAEVDVRGPFVLAYLLLTRDARVTVSRGEESTEGLNNMELYAGDEVTVLTGEARLLYPEIGMSYLAEGTTVLIMPSEEASDGDFNVNVILEAGKIWTRLERLLGMDQDFSVEASDVVATVRGTAFGVSVVNGEVDITVADHQVQVSTRQAIQGLKDIATKAVNLAAGSKVQVKAADLRALENPRAAILKKLRALTDTEKNDLFYRVAQRKLDTSVLKKPDLTFKWSAPIHLDPRILERLTPVQIRRLQLIRERQELLRVQLQQLEEAQRLKILQQVKFQVPLQQVILEDFQPTTEPSATGPGG